MKVEEWMAPYLAQIVYTGNNSVESLLQRERATIQINAPLALIQTAVEAQVAFLHNLKAAGLLAGEQKCTCREFRTGHDKGRQIGKAVDSTGCPIHSPEARLAHSMRRKV